MTAKGGSRWYADRRAGPTLSLDDEMAKRRTTARAAGMFDEHAERYAFEAFFRESRRDRGATFVDLALRRRYADQSYESDATQHHWWTWCIAVGGGQLLPKFDAIKLAADRAAQAQRDRQFPDA